MTTTLARIGYDTKFAIENAVGSGVYVELAEVFSVTPPSGTIDQIDATHMQSPDRTREFIPGLKDAGSASAEMNYIPNSSTDQLLMLLSINGEKRSMRITYPNGVTVTFPASVESYEQNIPLDDKMTAVITLKVSGAVTIAAAAAPTNTTAPAISGVAQVGVTLTAWEGIWTGSPSFGYVWNLDGVPIVGATGKTYTPVVGDIGDPITVTVTGTNTAGSASATSVATAAVIAA
jgi:predicted secreted protein